MVRSAARMSGVPRSRRGRIAVPAVLSGVALAVGVPAAMAASATAAHPRVIATVKVGTQPSDVAVSPVTGAAYVVNPESSSVTVISAKTNKVAATIRLKPGRSKLAPYYVAVSPVSGDVYVSNVPGKPGDKGSVTVISGRTSKVITTIPVASEPGEAVVSPKTGEVYVTGTGASATSGSVTVINGRTQKVITTIKLHARPWHLAVSPKTGDIYMASPASDPAKDRVTVISGKTNKVIASVPVAVKASSGQPVDPYEVAVSPVTGTVYVVSGGYHTGNLVTAISGKTNKVTAVIPNTAGYFAGTGEIAISPKTGTVYVTNNLANNVSVISGKTNTVTGFIKFPAGYLHTEDVAVNPVTGDVYADNVIYGVVSPGGGVGTVGAFWVINGKTNKPAGHVIVKDGLSISQQAISPRTGDVYSVGSANDVSVISG